MVTRISGKWSEILAPLKIRNGSGLEGTPFFELFSVVGFWVFVNHPESTVTEFMGKRIA